MSKLQVTLIQSIDKTIVCTITPTLVTSWEEQLSKGLREAVDAGVPWKHIRATSKPWWNLDLQTQWKHVKLLRPRIGRWRSRYQDQPTPTKWPQDLVQLRHTFRKTLRAAKEATWGSVIEKLASGGPQRC